MADSTSPASSASASFIHMVHRLIEECILFNMSKEDCMNVLSEHANILPLVTSAVWKELEKENPVFFDAYAKRRMDTMTTASREANMQRLRQMLSSDSTKLPALTQ